MWAGDIPARWRSALIAVLAWCCPAHAQDVAPGVTNVRFRNYSVDQGLSQPTAQQIVQDKYGFIWIATQDGLNRFDGYSFKVYKHLRGDPWSLADNAIKALVADPDGSLWIGTQAGGLNRYDPVLDRFEPFAADPAQAGALAANQVTALMLDRRNWLWVASAAGKLQWLDPATRHFIDTPLGMQPVLSSVHTFAEQEDGSVLIGTQSGLWRCDANASSMHELRLDPVQSLNVQALTVAHDGQIWVAATGAGVFRLDKDGNALARYRMVADPAHALPDDDVRGMQFDGAGKLWLATRNGGLLQLDPATGGVRQFSNDPADARSIAANRQQSILIDRDGLIWAGSWNNGVSLHDPRSEAFATVAPLPSDPRTLPARPVWAIAAGRDATLWLGISEHGGLVHFDPARGVLVRFAPKANTAGALPPNQIQAITQARDDSLWVGTNGGGLHHLAPAASAFEAYHHDAANADTLASEDLLHLMQDKSGTLWVGTVDAGLDELCEGCRQFRHHRHDPQRADSISEGPVTTVLEAADGSLWVALRPGGLDHYDRAHDRFEHFRANPQDATTLSNNTITALTIDSHGELWVGTQGGGLNHLLPASAVPRFEAITTAQGLAADAIGAIVEDSAHALWLSTTVGISRYDPTTRHIVNYSARDGASGQGYVINSFAQLADGRMAFGGPGGMTLLDPARVKAAPAPTPILTGVLLDNQPVELQWRSENSPLRAVPWGGGPAQFNYRQKNVGFEFSALGFSDPESIEYEYLLEGHDSDWIRTGAARRFATYTNLAAGDDHLRVRTRRDGDPWTQQEARMDVRVLPAPWLSPLAVLGYCAALMTIAGWFGWRTRENLRRQRVAQRAVRASADRLKLALWGNGGEMWDINLQDGSFVQENRIPGLAVGGINGPRTVHEYRKYIHTDDLSGFEQALIAHLKGRADFFEATYRTPDLSGEWRWLLTRGRAVERDANGRALRLVGTTQDITVLKRAEESLRKLNEELESRVEARTSDLRKANNELRQTLEQLTQAQRQLLESEKMAALGGLVAGVAHEINTPLGVTVTAASHLQEEARRIGKLAASHALTPEELAEFHDTANESSEIILRNLNRADRLIKSFKQVAVDQSSEERRTIELGAYLNEILISLGPALKKTAHQVRIDCPTPVTLNTYPGAIYQIISNLLMNSIYHAFAPGQAGQITIAVKQAASQVELTYNDNGHGMSAEVRARIFEPFFTTRRGEGGSGLGMHVVYNLVTQLLKGRIDVSSAPEAGTTFAIVVPTDAVASPQPHVGVAAEGLS
jgi:ligand-binding sensor domain-containing protein/signal transduction histidine kinase